jgi:hypothetical protein
MLGTDHLARAEAVRPKTFNKFESLNCVVALFPAELAGLDLATEWRTRPFNGGLGFSGSLFPAQRRGPAPPGQAPFWGPSFN